MKYGDLLSRIEDGGRNILVGITAGENPGFHDRHPANTIVFAWPNIAAYIYDISQCPQTKLTAECVE